MMFKTNRLSLSFEPKFHLCGNSIDCVKKIKYLGFVLTSDLGDDDDMNKQLYALFVALPISYVGNFFVALKL